MNFERKQQMLFILWTIAMLGIGTTLTFVGTHLALWFVGGVGVGFVALAVLMAVRVVS